MTFTVKYNTQASVFASNIGKVSSAYALAITKAKQRLADEITSAGQVQIASAGLGNKFSQSFFASVDGNTITVGSSIPFFGVFDKNSTIKGKPILWIPLSFGSKQRVSQYKGHLALVNRIGAKPLLIDTATHKPQFVGVDSVEIKKRLDIASVIDKAVKAFPGYIQDEIKGARNG